MEISIIICLMILVIFLFFDRANLKQKIVPYNLYYKSLSLLRKWVNNQNFTNQPVCEKLLEETKGFLNYIDKSLK